MREVNRYDLFLVSFEGSKKLSEYYSVTEEERIIFVHFMQRNQVHPLPNLKY